MASPTISWVKGRVKIIDQTKLPQKLLYVYCKDVKSLWQAIKQLKVRGAPALGVAAAYGVLLGTKSYKGRDCKKFIKYVDKLCDYIGSARPTAVNIFNVLENIKETIRIKENQGSVDALKFTLREYAAFLYEGDKRICRRMGAYGQKLIKNGQNLLTICNTGALATVDYGTALGVMFSAKEKGKKFHVYTCETRPLLQGARLNTWELMRANIDVTLICDSMAATLMKQKKISAVFTGADRIASNGDTANKIGTYNLAVLAKYHRIPFYVVAPLSTFDRKINDGRDIPIEEREKEEIIYFRKQQTAPRNVKVFNPAFDVTDHGLITAIVTGQGIIKPPYRANIKRLYRQLQKRFH